MSEVDDDYVLGGILINFLTSDIEATIALEMVHSMVISIENLRVAASFQFLLPHSILATP